ncbi:MULTISPECIES: membrane protein insertase YidC [unclassified Sulfitobacter]|uniref:membrane protein insertase YidC n=1 Tax=unclassified Sulfitobacter TaxID=196795 RepID=UPI0007C35528|nr:MULTISPECIES: membrane protein insertase YidC [unclassified Sulfitobacter]KZY06107.1 membrane protein insertase YidC [Sulfitobacter sp. HI0023]KZY24795.1 membrane protein insertase YidC [Sulfitobacter sp. HI0040]KZZ63288.1 membrane protein insertase YidC [Sulfitobacter sp. HI0129]
MDEQNKNLILATVLSFIVILVWFVVFPPPETQAPTETAAVEQSDTGTATVPPAVSSDSADVTVGDAAVGADTTAQTLAEAPRVPIATDALSGSISLLGGRIDDLSLNDYRTTIDEDAPIVTMLSPAGTPDAYYAMQGWAAGAGLPPEAVPGLDTLWEVVEGETLGVDSPITLQWQNDAGLTFRRTISVDDRFMFTITQSVLNDSDTVVSLAPYGMVAHHGVPSDLKSFFILHEGAVSMADGELLETDWDEIPEAEVDPKWGRQAIVRENVMEGWIGFSDHYWQAVLIPGDNQGVDQALTYNPRSDIYHAFTRLPTQTVAAGQTATVTTQLFAGAKEWEILRHYEDLGVTKFIDSIDWGWFFFLTKPIFWVLHELNQLIGNMGIAIIALTLLIKALLFPLAYKSYVSMAKMKELQPQMEKLKKEAGDDRQKMQQGMMELYKREKVNPAAGCLPILLQIPIFFSLYKVIFVTIELRHAPFFGPFQDLSAPDPTSIFNLYGLLPFAAPETGTILALIFIGILPLLLGISMWLQQKLNPAPTDPTQQMIFAWMPWVFMFMLGGFASGLVVYWIANNTITFTQQYLIMRSQGYKPDLLGNIKSGFARKSKPDAKK